MLALCVAGSSAPHRAAAKRGPHKSGPHKASLSNGHAPPPPPPPRANSHCTQGAVEEMERAQQRAVKFSTSCEATKRYAKGENAAKYAQLMSKVGIKERVQAWLPEMRVVPTLAAVYDADEITEAFVAKMPREYVVKAAHGAGMVMLVRGEVARDVTCGRTVSKKLGCTSKSRSAHARFIGAHCRHWLGVDYGRLYGEKAYSRVRPSCVFEASLLDEVGNAPRDLKVFVAHGEPLFLMDVANRFGLNRSKSTTHVLVDTDGLALPGAYGGKAAALADYRTACADRAQEHSISAV